MEILLKTIFVVLNKQGLHHQVNENRQSGSAYYTSYIDVYPVKHSLMKSCKWKLFVMIDIYFEPNYGKLYEKIENGNCEVFRYSSAFGNVYHLFIKREIPVRVNNKTYYDLVTPYGYGGP